MKNKVKPSTNLIYEKIEYPENPLDTQDSNLEEDTEFLEFLKTIESPDVPESIEKNVMKGYSKHYRYKILRRKIRIKVQQLKDFILEHLPGNLELKSDLFKPIAATGMILFLVTISAIIYYSFYSGNKVDSKPIANNASTTKPTITPTSTTKPPPPGIITMNKNANTQKDKLNRHESIDNKENETKKDKLVPNNTEPKKKIEEVNDIVELENKIAQIINTGENEIKRKASNDAKVKITTIDIDINDPKIEEQFKQEILANGKWTITKNEPDGRFILDDNSLELTTKKGYILFDDEKYNKHKKNPNYVKLVIKLLVNKYST